MTDYQQAYSFCNECAVTLARMADNSWKLYTGLRRAKSDIARSIHPWPHRTSHLERKFAGDLVAAAEAGVTNVVLTDEGLQMRLFDGSTMLRLESTWRYDRG